MPTQIAATGPMEPDNANENKADEAWTLSSGAKGRWFESARAYHFLKRLARRPFPSPTLNLHRAGDQIVVAPLGLDVHASTVNQLGGWPGKPCGLGSRPWRRS